MGKGPVDKQLPETFVLPIFVKVFVVSKRGDKRAEHFSQVHRDENFIAEGKGLKCPIFRFRPSCVPRLAKRRFGTFLVKVKYVSDLNTAFWAGEGMFLTILMTNLCSGNEFRIARIALNGASDNHGFSSLVFMAGGPASKEPKAFAEDIPCATRHG